MNKLKIAVVGVGYLGSIHADKLKHTAHCQLVAVCDRDWPKAVNVAERLSVEAVEWYRELLGKVDAVTIATTTNTHYEIAQFFLENGVHVFVEKPISAETAEAEQLLLLANANNLVLAVGHIERFNPTVLELRKHIKSPKSIEFIRHAPFRKRGADVSVIHDLMIHDLDLMLWLGNVKKEEIVSLQATAARVISQTYDASTAHFSFSNGLHVFLTISRGSPGIERRIRVIDHDSVLLANTGEGTIDISNYQPNGVSNDLEENFATQRINIHPKDALENELVAYIETVKAHQQGQTFVSELASGLDGYTAMQLVDVVMEAIEGQEEIGKQIVEESNLKARKPGTKMLFKLLAFAGISGF